VTHDRVIEQEDSIPRVTDSETELRLLIGLEMWIEASHLFED
jgi:hypothetical protein